MAIDPVQLYGRGSAFDLVRAFLERPRPPRRVPVLVFVGPRGSGKTELLKNLAAEFDHHAPYAFVDMATLPGPGLGNANPVMAHEVLTAIAFDLNRQRGDQGRIAFPRFLVGKLVMKLVLDLGNRPTARGQVERALEEHRNIPRIRQFLRDLAAETLRRVPPSKVPFGVAMAARYLPDLLLAAFRTSRLGRTVLLGKGQAWYGDQDRGLGRDPLDELVELNRMGRRMDVQANRRGIDDMFLGAFLADLQGAFDAGRREFNCAVLLDNADTTIGLDFMRALVRARQQRSDQAGDADPVTVVAASRGILPAAALAAVKRMPDLDEASYDHYRDQSGGPSGPWWYPVGLRNLNGVEAENMAAALAPPQADSQLLAEVVYRFTHGHPASTRLLFDAIAERPEQVDLRELLDQPEPEKDRLGGAAARKQGEKTVRDRLREDLLGDFPEDSIPELVTSAAARDQRQVSLLATECQLPTASPTGYDAVLDSEVWVAGPEGAPPVMQPVLRRLLLCELASRGAGGLPSWPDVHGWFRARCAADGDETGELYHALALHDLKFVTEELAVRLRSTPVGEWQTLLRAVVEAPNRLDPTDAPIRLVTSLTRWADRRDRLIEPMARLVAALWIDADPLSGSRRAQLHENLHSAYISIAPWALDGLGELQAEARRYDELARGAGLG